mmetsp:Transcript_19564/g.38751  ORF Transcript_19564/g.38751 Transcript_19564/m.38751 type:complete len:277 (+) Transcript_19564:2966-3796(+)
MGWEVCVLQQVKPLRSVTRASKQQLQTYLQQLPRQTTASRLCLLLQLPLQLLQANSPPQQQPSDPPLCTAPITNLTCTFTLSSSTPAPLQTHLPALLVCFPLYPFTTRSRLLLPLRLLVSIAVIPFQHHPERQIGCVRSRRSSSNGATRTGRTGTCKKESLVPLRFAVQLTDPGVYRRCCLLGSTTRSRTLLQCQGLPITATVPVSTSTAAPTGRNSRRVKKTTATCTAITRNGCEIFRCQCFKLFNSWFHRARGWVSFIMGRKVFTQLALFVVFL